jgi:hypothetical protein
VRRNTRHFRADRGAKQQRNKRFGLLLLARRERQGQDFSRRFKRPAKHAREGDFGNPHFVCRNGEAPLADVENALGRAAIVDRIVTDTLLHAVRLENLGLERVFVRGQ